MAVLCFAVLVVDVRAQDGEAPVDPVVCSGAIFCNGHVRLLPRPASDDTVDSTSLVITREEVELGLEGLPVRAEIRRPQSLGQISQEAVALHVRVERLSGPGGVQIGSPQSVSVTALAVAEPSKQKTVRVFADQVGMGQDNGIADGDRFYRISLIDSGIQAGAPPMEWREPSGTAAISPNSMIAAVTLLDDDAGAVFTVTPMVGAGFGFISPPGPIQVEQGATATFFLFPDPGFSLAGVQGSCGGFLQGDAFTTNPVFADCSVIADFVVEEYVVTPLAGSGGSISPSFPQMVGFGASAVFTITPSQGFTIAAVAGSCGGFLSGSTYITDPVFFDCTVEASFSADTITRTVTPSAGANGSISPNTPQPVNQGQTTSFAVTPNSGFTASVGGTCGGNLVGTIYTTNAITANCTVVASFSAITHTVAPSASANGSISPSTPQAVNQGHTTSFTVVPNSGFTASVGGTCGGFFSGSTYITDPISGDCTVMANFQQGGLSGQCGSASGGTFASAPTSNLCAVGTASAVSGSGPWNWSCNGGDGGPSVQCSANIQTYTVTPSAGSGGSISPSSSQTVNHGSTVQFSITPDSGFGIQTATGCGGSLTGNTFTTGPVTSNCAVSATFTQDTIDGVCGAANGGTFTTAPTTNLCSAGTPSSVSGDGPWSWACSGSGGGSSASCSANVQTYTVTPFAGPGGSISPSTPQTVNHGATVTFSLGTDAGFVVGPVSGSCGGGLSGFSVTTASVTANCNVQASFVAAPDAYVYYEDGLAVVTGGDELSAIIEVGNQGIGGVSGLQFRIEASADQFDSASLERVGAGFELGNCTPGSGAVPGNASLTHFGPVSLDLAPNECVRFQLTGTYAWDLPRRNQVQASAFFGTPTDLDLSNNQTKDINRVDALFFDGMEAGVQRFSVGGVVFGLEFDVLVLRMNGQEVDIFGEGGGDVHFEFPAALSSGSWFEVGVPFQPADQFCEVQNGAGNIQLQDVSDVSVFCFDAGVVFFTVMPIASEGGSIEPSVPVLVEQGGTVDLVLTADSGFFVADVQGSCGGSLAGDIFTTAPVFSDCTVEVSFSVITHTVTPSADANGSISPNTPQVVYQGEAAIFTVTPSVGFVMDTVGGTCGGNLAGDTFTTDAITGDCTVEASFIHQVLL